MKLEQLEVVQELAAWYAATIKWVLPPSEEKTNTPHIGNINVHHNYTLKNKTAKEQMKHLGFIADEDLILKGKATEVTCTILRSLGTRKTCSITSL